MNDIPREIKKEIAVIRDHNGYTRRLRIVSWNGAEPKLDFREWLPDGRPGKGFPLTDEEGLLLLEGLNGYFEEKCKPDNEETENDSDVPF